MAERALLDIEIEDHATEQFLGFALAIKHD